MPGRMRWPKWQAKDFTRSSAAHGLQLTASLEYCSAVNIRDGSCYQIGWIFGKVSKEGGGGGRGWRGGHYQSKDLYCRFWTFIKDLFQAFSDFFPNCNIIFESEGGGSKAVWNYSENSSDLIAWPVPKSPMETLHFPTELDTIVGKHTINGPIYDLSNRFETKER